MKIELLAYTITWLLSYILIKIDYNQYLRKYNYMHAASDYYVNSQYKKKIRIITILLVALIWVGFNTFLTSLHPVMGNDWINYSVNFSGQRETPSIGLAFLINFIRGMGGSMYTLSRFSTFSCMIITLVAYRYSKDASPSCFIFLFLTEYSFLTISLLKQTFANAIASLFFVIAIQHRTKKVTIICSILIALACVFHPAGYVLIPMFVVLRQSKTTKNIAIYIALMLGLALFFRPIMVSIGGILTPIIPAIGTKIAQYFNGDLVADEDRSLVFIKSIPELCIVLLGLYKRKKLVNVIENYDNYLLVATTGEFLYLMSLYSTWLYRMIYLFHFAIFVFFDAVLRNLSLKSNSRIISLIVGLMLGIIMYRFLDIYF